MSVRKRTWTSNGEAKEAWIVDYTDQAGSRHIETFGRKKDADARHADIGVDVRKGTHVAASKSITVEEASKRWLKSAEADGLERATIKGYADHVRLHINPVLGRTKLSEISVPTVSWFRGQLHDRGVTTANAKKILVSFGTLLGYALEHGLVGHNAVRELRRNAGGKKKAKVDQKPKLRVGVDIPTLEEIGRIIEHSTGRWRPLLMTAAFTGLRASELRGLRWIDIDFKKGELHVRQRADRYNDIGKPKSDAGERTIPLVAPIANELRKLKLQSGERKLVFSNGNDNVEALSNIIVRGLCPAQKRARLLVNGEPKYTGLHCLRHFFASFLVNSVEDGGLGLQPKRVQELMGHAKISLTMDTYSHLFPATTDHTAWDSAVARVLGNA